MRSLILLLLCTFLYAESNITYIDLRTEKFVLGVSPSVGGRIYKLIADNQNMCIWDETLLYNWNRKNHYGYHMYGGHEVWLSPQSAWKKAWPPEMNISTLPWTILKQDPQSISLQSTIRDGSSWQAKRDIKIINQESFSNTITLTNISDTEQTAGIWFMNRCRRDTRIHFPNDIKGKDDVSSALMKDDVIKGKPYKRIKYNDHRPGKLYYHSNANECFVTRNGVRWRISLSFTPDGTPHKEQADYEIARLSGIVEYEFHGPCVKVKPKASISATETWSVEILGEK